MTDTPETVRLAHPYSTQEIEVLAEVADRYREQGWTEPLVSVEADEPFEDERLIGD